MPCSSLRRNCSLLVRAASPQCCNGPLKAQLDCPHPRWGLRFEIEGVLILNPPSPVLQAQSLVVFSSLYAFLVLSLVQTLSQTDYSVFEVPSLLVLHVVILVRVCLAWLKEADSSLVVEFPGRGSKERERKRRGIGRNVTGHAQLLWMRVTRWETLPDALGISVEYGPCLRQRAWKTTRRLREYGRERRPRHLERLWRAHVGRKWTVCIHP